MFTRLDGNFMCVYIYICLSEKHFDAVEHSYIFLRFPTGTPQIEVEGLELFRTKMSRTCVQSLGA